MMVVHHCGSNRFIYRLLLWRSPLFFCIFPFSAHKSVAAPASSGKKWLENGQAGAEDALQTGRKREESEGLDVHQGFERRLHVITFLFQAFIEQYQNKVCHK